MRLPLSQRRIYNHPAVISVVALGYLILAWAPRADTNEFRTVQFREPRSTHYVLVDSGGTNLPPRAGLLWLRARPESGPTNDIVEFGSREPTPLDSEPETERNAGFASNAAGDGCGRARSDKAGFQPYWGKPAVRDE
jgi:hypothetical protein